MSKSLKVCHCSVRISCQNIVTSLHQSGLAEKHVCSRSSWPSAHAIFHSHCALYVGTFWSVRPALETPASTLCQDSYDGEDLKPVVLINDTNYLIAANETNHTDVVLAQPQVVPRRPLYFDETSEQGLLSPLSEIISVVFVYIRWFSLQPGIHTRCVY